MNETEQKLDATKIGIQVKSETKLAHKEKKRNIERVFDKVDNKKILF